MPGGNVTVHTCLQVLLVRTSQVLCMHTDVAAVNVRTFRLVFHAVNGCKVAHPKLHHAAITAQYEYRCTVNHCLQSWTETICRQSVPC